MSPLIWLLIIFIALVVGFALLVRFVKAFARTIVLLVILGIIVAGGIYVIRDANDLRANFLPREKLLVLDVDGNIVAAVISKDVSVPVPVADVKGINAMYQVKDYKGILGTKYKLLVFRWDAFRDLKVVGENQYVFSMDDAKQIMKTADPKKELIDKLARGQEFSRGIVSAEVQKMFPTNDYFRSVVFSFIIAKSLEDASVFEAYANGDVSIYPETITLKLLKWLPFEWVRDFVSDKM